MDDEKGVATVSALLLDRVTKYHAHLGTASNVARYTLLDLERRLLEEAKNLCYTKRYEEALNVFTHALAVSEKASEGESSSGTTKACIVHNIGYTLHCLGEFEAAGAYYEQALEHFRNVKAPLIDRYTVEWIFGSVNDSRVQFIRERLLDVSFRRLPDAEYLDEYGRKRAMPTNVPESSIPPRLDAPSMAWEASSAAQSQRQPRWLAARDEAAPRAKLGDELVESHGGQEDSCRSAGGSAGGSCAEEAADDGRTREEEEEARREWFEYHLKVGEWAEASELVVTAAEREDLDYLIEKAERERAAFAVGYDGLHGR